jgi:PhoPQ-activated pathogenicity-related protein
MRLRYLAFLCTCLAPPAQASDYTALDRYVAAPDASYSYSLVRTLKFTGLTAYQIDMVSQTWRSAAEVDKPVWHHWLTIYKPDQVTTSTALLFIDGGSNSSSPPTPDATTLVEAAGAGTVFADLGQVPNEPLLFAGETTPRTEDAIIAYTWSKFLNGGDDYWPARLPMTKAAVRAMDTVTAFLGSLSSGPVAVKNFVVAGASKRGWTTWSTAVVDPRVIAIAPIVIDTLNVENVFTSQYRAYGFWAPAVQDYYDAGIMNWFGTPQMAALLDIEDPFEYAGRLALPSFQMNSTGDQFFLPDSPRFYFPELPGEKYLRFLPNTDHSVVSTDTVTNLLAWYHAVLQNTPRPRFTWRTDPRGGSIVVRVVDTPSKVLVWSATNSSARDFRLETIGAAWSGATLQGDNGVYTATVPMPAKGWTAFFVELTFPGVSPDLPLVFTTEVVVTPDQYPFDSPSGLPMANPRRPAPER